MLTSSARLLGYFVFIYFNISIQLISYARPLDAVGSCPAGKVAIENGQMAGTAIQVKQNHYMHNHFDKITREEAAWLHHLTGRSGVNRSFIHHPQHVIIFTICNPQDCQRNRAYVGFDTASNYLGGIIFEGQRSREIGISSQIPVLPSLLSMAITCAVNLDWQIKNLMP